MTPRKGQRLIPQNERKQRLLTIRLTDDEYRGLARIAKRQKLPIARFIREGIDLVVQKYSN
jgi:hypothetical protein